MAEGDDGDELVSAAHRTLFWPDCLESKGSRSHLCTSLQSGLAAPPHLALILAEDDLATPTSPATTPGRAKDDDAAAERKCTRPTQTSHCMKRARRSGRAADARRRRVLKSRTARLLC